MSDPRILIILMGSIGDVARGTAVLKPIKRAWPLAHITWLVEPDCEPILRGSKFIDEILVFDRRKPAAGMLKLARDLRQRHFDISLDLQRHLKSGLFSRLSGASRRIGFNRRDSKEMNFLFQTEEIRRIGNEISKVAHYREFLHQLGIAPGEVEFALEHLREPVDFDISEIDPNKVSVGLVLGSSWESKNWTLEGWKKLLSLIKSDPRFQPILLGAPEHRASADLLLAEGAAGVVSYVGRTNLRSLSYVLSKIKILVGPDSGPGHIAAGLGLRQVTLFGPTLPSRVEPFGSEALSMAPAIGCAPCLRKVCPGLYKICMRLHSPEAVFNRLKAAIGL